MEQLLAGLWPKILSEYGLAVLVLTCTTAFFARVWFVERSDRRADSQVFTSIVGQLRTSLDNNTTALNKLSDNMRIDSKETVAALNDLRIAVINGGRHVD